jgi:hypothetical protein
MFSSKKRKMEKDAKKLELIKKTQDHWEKFQNVHNKVYSVRLSLKSLLNAKEKKENEIRVSADTSKGITTPRRVHVAPDRKDKETKMARQPDKRGPDRQNLTGKGKNIYIYTSKMFKVLSIRVHPEFQSKSLLQLSRLSVHPSIHSCIRASACSRASVLHKQG